MPDYSKGKIYKLQCEDGHFYIGSTCDELRKRFWVHKANSKRASSPLYLHIGEDWESVRIVLVEEFPCENKEQLIRKEDEHIRQHNNDPLCLNVRRAILTPTESYEMNRQARVNWEVANREKRNARARERYALKKTAA